MITFSSPLFFIWKTVSDYETERSICVIFTIKKKKKKKKKNDSSLKFRTRRFENSAFCERINEPDMQDTAGEAEMNS